MDNELLFKLEQRLGRIHAKQRLGIETDHEAQIFGQGLNFFHIENWYSIQFVHSKSPEAIRPLLAWAPKCRARHRQAEHYRVRQFAAAL
jgi:hypothetical protein